MSRNELKQNLTLQGITIHHISQIRSLESDKRLLPIFFVSVDIKEGVSYIHVSENLTKEQGLNGQNQIY